LASEGIFPFTGTATISLSSRNPVLAPVIGTDINMYVCCQREYVYNYTVLNYYFHLRHIAYAI
jgi:hypothetical protein